MAFKECNFTIEDTTEESRQKSIQITNTKNQTLWIIVITVVLTLAHYCGIHLPQKNFEIQLKI